MKNLLLISLCALTALSMAGCGGGGGSSSSGSNKYAGSYSGTFSIGALGTYGTISFIVDSSGNIASGTEQSSAGSVPIAGNVAGSGAATITGGSGGTATGVVDLSSNGAMSGTFVFTTGSDIHDTFTFSVTAGAETNDPYGQTFSGTYDDTTTNVTGTVSLVVDSAGSITSGALTPTSTTGNGYYLSGNLSDSGALSLSTVLTTGAGPIEPESGQLTSATVTPVTGTLNGSIGSITISLTGSGGVLTPEGNAKTHG